MLSGCRLIGIVPTTDTMRARAFYCGVLGLEFLEDDGFAVVLKVREATLRIVPIPEFRPAAGTLLGWEVPEIEPAVQQLSDAGVVFERYGYFKQDALGIWTAPNGSRVAWFRDPDGNTLSLSQHVAVIQVWPE